MVLVVGSVADAAVVHIEDNARISDGVDFWHALGLLQVRPRPQCFVQT